jgi:branched-chain amino acid transport system ATP-binding protein
MLLQVNNLSINFGRLSVIRHLSFNVNDHEILGIIGPNGAGKSTLFNLLTGFLFPDSGDILFKGENINQVPAHIRVQQGMARTFQSTKIFLNQSVLDNLIVGLIPKKEKERGPSFLGRKCTDDTQLSRYGQELADFVGLNDRLDVRAGDLDQEARKRLAIGIALSTNPSLLLLDEPTGGINLEEINRLMDLIRNIAEKGITICLIEHKMKMIMELCQRIIVLNYGQKIAEGTPQEIRVNESAIKAYLGEEYVA